MTPLPVEESIEDWEKEAPDFSDLYKPKDWRPRSLHSSPWAEPSPWAEWDFEEEEEALKKFSLEAQEEELKNCPDTTFYRALRQFNADKRAELQREAEALGFPSWDAKERHDREEDRKWLEEYVKEHGHLPRPPTMTEEQRAIFERKQERQREAERELLEHRCHCLG